MFNSRSDVISTHKKFTWTDFWGIYTHISPHHYTMAVIQPLSGTLAHFTSNTAVAAYMLVTMEVRH